MTPLLRGAAAAALILLAPASAMAAAPSKLGELDALRQECIAAGRDTQQQEAVTAALEHDVALLGREADGRQRGLDESRSEQARFLGLIERLARNPPDTSATGRVAAEAPIDHIRSNLLLEATLPALQAEGRALAGEVERVAALRAEIAAKKAALGAASDALGKDRVNLAQLVARRLELTRRLVPEESGSEAQIAKPGRDASDIGDLIKRADAAIDRHDKELLAHARAALPPAKAATLTPEEADPTRPREMRAFDPPQSQLTTPISGTISQRFGAVDDTGAAGIKGLRLAARPGGAALAPFDGRVIFVGPFGNLGLVLIIRVGGQYHTVLAGLSRIDVKAGQWLRAGEPVGAMPDAVDKAAPTLYVELRRDGRPVDPLPYLAVRDDGDGGQGVNRRDGNQPDGNQKVRE